MTPLFRPLPGKSPLTEGELRALDLMLTLSQSEVIRAVNEVATDALMPNSHRAAVIWAFACITLERMEVWEDVEFLLHAYEDVPKYSRVCPECDTVLSGGYCPVCRETIHAH